MGSFLKSKKNPFGPIKERKRYMHLCIWQMLLSILSVHAFTEN